MLFQTWPFILFFALLYPVYLLARGARVRLALLLVGSYVFYAWLGPLYLIPLAIATVVDYFVVARMAQSRRRKLWLSLSIVTDLTCKINARRILVRCVTLIPAETERRDALDKGKLIERVFGRKLLVKWRLAREK